MPIATGWCQCRSLGTVDRIKKILLGVVKVWTLEDIVSTDDLRKDAKLIESMMLAHRSCLAALSIALCRHISDVSTTLMWTHLHSNRSRTHATMQRAQ